MAATLRVSAPARRLTAAIAASACIHALFTQLVSEPGGRRGASGIPGPALSARIVTAQAQPAIAEPAFERPAAPAPAPRSERKPAAPKPRPAVEMPGSRSSGLDLPDATYYGVRQLDVFPALAAGFELRYPQRAAAADAKGRVALLVLIDASGAVNDVSVVEAQPPGLFEEDAVRTLRAARFTPAMKDGRAVKSRIVIEVNYGGG